MESEEYQEINNKLLEIQLNYIRMNTRLSDMKNNILIAHIIIFMLISIWTYLWIS